MLIIRSDRPSALIYNHTTSLLADELGIDTSRVPQPRSSSPSDVETLGAVLADLGTPIATQTIAAALAWAPERVRAAVAQLRHELQRLGQTVTLSPSDQLGLAPFATCISDKQRAAVRREALTIDDATAHVLLAVLRGRRDERSWNKLDDNRRAIATQLVAAGAITEDHSMLAPSEQLARAFEPGQLFGLDW
jgi:hypothetical protein